MKTQFRFEAAKLKAMAPPKAGRLEFSDAAMSGLQFRVTHAGVKSFSVLTRGVRDGERKLIRQTIGVFTPEPEDGDAWKKHPMEHWPTQAIGLAQARERAAQVIEDIRKGVDPKEAKAKAQAASKRERANTFGAVRDQYVREHVNPEFREQTAYEVKRVLNYKDPDAEPTMRGKRKGYSNPFAAWEARPIASITEDDVRELIGKIRERGAKTMARRTFAYLQGLFHWAKGERLISVVPTADIRPKGKKTAAWRETKRNRDLYRNPKELELFWAATTGEGVFNDFARLLLLTGKREQEVAGMRWSELRIGGPEPLWRIPGGRTGTKNAEDQLVPLPALAVEILTARPKIEITDAKGETVESDFVLTTTGKASISGFSKAKQDLDERIEKAKNAARAEKPTGDDRKNLEAAFAEPWVWHDLRRAIATGCADKGFAAPHVIEVILGHKLPGVAGVYNLAEHLAPRRVALERWATYVSTLGAQPTDSTNVKQFRAA
jgi:integrase